MGALTYYYCWGYDGVFPSVAAPKADALPACATPPDELRVPLTVSHYKIISYVE